MLSVLFIIRTQCKLIHPAGLAKYARAWRWVRPFHRKVRVTDRGRTENLGIDRDAIRFVQLVRKYYPHCLLHFEDFGVTNAYRLLERYREQHAVFNDDV